MCTCTAAKSCIAHFWGNDRMMGSCGSWMERLPSRTYGWPWVQNLHWVMACTIIFLLPRQRHWHMSRWKTHPPLVFARQGDHANLERMPSDCFGEVRESCANTRMSAQSLSTQRTGVAPSSCLRPRTMQTHKRFSSLGRLACSAFTNSDAFCSAKLGRNKSKCATPKISIGRLLRFYIIM